MTGSVIHPSAVIEEGARLGAGVRIGPGLTVQVTKFEVKKFP